MVAGARGAALVAAPLQRPRADFVGLGVGQAAAGLGMLDVAAVASPRWSKWPTPSPRIRRISLASKRYGPPMPTPAGMRWNSSAHQLRQPRRDIRVRKLVRSSRTPQLMS